MLHLTHFSTNCSVVQRSPCHLSLSQYATHASIIHKRGGKQTEEWGNMCTRQQKSTNTCNHITANAFHIWPRERTDQTAKENPMATRYFNEKALTSTRKSLHILHLLSGLINILYCNINISSQQLMSYWGPDPGELQGLWVVD